MRRVFFFSCGLIAATALLIIFSDDDASSARIKKPKLRATVIFPSAEGSTQLPVSFSHSSHARFGYSKCTLCHNDEVFSKDKTVGANNITMDGINEGKWCGHCHNGTLTIKNADGEDEPVFAPVMQNISQCVLCHNVKNWKRPEKGKGWEPPKAEGEKK